MLQNICSEWFFTRVSTVSTKVTGCSVFQTLLEAPIYSYGRGGGTSTGCYGVYSACAVSWVTYRINNLRPNGELLREDKKRSGDQDWDGKGGTESQSSKEGEG